MLDGNTLGTGWKGHYSTGLLDALSTNLRSRRGRLPATAKMLILTAAHIRHSSHGLLYARSQNLARQLRDAYDRALEEVDLLVMPTLPTKAPRQPGPEVSVSRYLAMSDDMSQNTSPFNVTGHPAITLPCSTSGGLPIGMMLVGRPGEDATVLRAADAFERRIYSAPEPGAQPTAGELEKRQPNHRDGC